MSELWALLNLISPSHFHSLQPFLAQYGNPPSSAAQLDALQVALRPCAPRISAHIRHDHAAHTLSCSAPTAHITLATCPCSPALTRPNMALTRRRIALTRPRIAPTWQVLARSEEE